MIDLSHLKIDQIEQLFQLVLPLLQVGIHLLYLTRYPLVVVLDLLQFMGRHDALRMVAVDLATHAH